MDRIFVGSLMTETDPYGNEVVKIGFTAADLEKMQAQINRRGFINLSLRVSAKGKKYLQLHPKSPKPVELGTRANGRVEVEPTAGESIIDPDDLPF